MSRIILIGFTYLWNVMILAQKVKGLKTFWMNGQTFAWTELTLNENSSFAILHMAVVVVCVCGGGGGDKFHIFHIYLDTLVNYLSVWL